MLDLILNQWFIKTLVDIDLTFEPVRNQFEKLVGIRIYNNERVEFTERVAEVKGYGIIYPDGMLSNWIFSLDDENRILSWDDDGDCITYGGHGLIRVVILENGKLRYCLKKQPILVSFDNANEATFNFEVEIRGKLRNKPITPKTCCIAFTIRKDVLDNEVFWAITDPVLKKGHCDYAETMSSDEFNKYKERLTKRSFLSDVLKKKTRNKKK